MPIIGAQALTADAENRGAILVGLEYIAKLVDRCAIYERLYLDHGKVWSETEDGLQSNLVFLYTKILIFFSKSREYYSRSTAREFRVRIRWAYYGQALTPIARRSYRCSNLGS